MNVIGNILWFVFGGFAICLEYIVAGIAMCATIIGIPWGLQSFKLAFLSLFPFGCEVVDVDDTPNLSFILNVIWFFIGGIWITLSHLVLGCIFFITIIGIPFARQHFKLMALSLAPFGKTIA